MHWPGALPGTSSTHPSRLVGIVELLPYQDSSALPADNHHGSIEILHSAVTVESGTHSTPRHSREVFMSGQPPHIAIPKAPDVQDGEETLFDISPDTTAPHREMNK